MQWARTKCVDQDLVPSRVDNPMHPLPSHLPLPSLQIIATGGEMGGIEERWDDPSKLTEFLGSAESGIMLGLVLGEGKERQGQAYFTRWGGVQRIQPIIAFIFSPNFVGLETRASQQNETPFCFSNFQTKQKLGIFTREIGKSRYS